MRGMSVAGTRGGYGQRPGLGGAAGQAGQPAGWSLLGKFSLHLLITALAGTGPHDTAPRAAAESLVSIFIQTANTRVSRVPTLDTGDVNEI